MKTVILIIITSCFVMFFAMCKRAANTAPFISFENVDPYNNYFADTLSGDTNIQSYTINLLIKNGSYGIKNIYIRFWDSIAVWHSIAVWDSIKKDTTYNKIIDGFYYAPPSIYDNILKPNIINPYDESFIEPLNFQLIKKYNEIKKYNWQIYVTDEGDNQSNTINKSIVLKPK